jgi:hypothetical protein
MRRGRGGAPGLREKVGDELAAEAPTPRGGLGSKAKADKP